MQKIPFALLAPQVDKLWQEMTINHPSLADKEQLDSYAKDKSEVIRELILSSGWEIEDYISWSFGHISPLN